MSRRSTVLPVCAALGALVLVLAVAPFVPRGGDDSSIRPSGQQYVATSGAPGFGKITPDLRREIDKVVDQGRVLGARLDARSSLDQRVQTLMRCANFEGQRYCLGEGWTESTQTQVQDRTEQTARVALERRQPVQHTGDLSQAAYLRQRAAMTIDQRARAERAELTMAAESVAKVWMLRHDIQGVPLPAGFLAEHPEARAHVDSKTKASPAAAPAMPTSTATPTPITTATVTPSGLPTVSPTDGSTLTATPTTLPTTLPTTAPIKTYDDYPDTAKILSKTQTAEQLTTYWCGPTALQMIAWGWKDKYRTQAHWAHLLGTTTAGSGIHAMVAMTNKHTGWDRPDFAGPYVAMDVANFTFDQWQLLLMQHIVDFHAPLILHVQLLKEFFPYLDHDGGGHFQVGRGYDKHRTRPDLIGYFEPWNQQRFHPDEPYISRVQWRQSYRTYRATLIHFQHDVGV